MADSRQPVLFLVIHVDVLGVYDAFVFLLLAFGRMAVGGGIGRWSACRSRSRLAGFVHLFGQFVRGGGQSFAGLVHRSFVGAFQRLLGVGDGSLDVAALGAGNFVAVLAQHFLHVVSHGIELVLGLDFLALGLVFCGVRFGVLRHAVDFFFAQARRRRDRNLLVLPRGVVL